MQAASRKVSQLVWGGSPQLRAVTLMEHVVYAAQSASGRQPSVFSLFGDCLRWSKDITHSHCSISNHWLMWEYQKLALCYGLNGVPQNSYVYVKSPKPLCDYVGNMTLKERLRLREIITVKPWSERTGVLWKRKRHLRLLSCHHARTQREGSICMPERESPTENEPCWTLELSSLQNREKKILHFLAP